MGKRASIQHADWLDINEGLEWVNLQAEAARLDEARRRVTAALNLLRQRAAQRALAARRKEPAGDA